MSFPEQKLIKEMIEYEKNDNFYRNDYNKSFEDINNICMNYTKTKKIQKQKNGYKKINIQDKELTCSICLENLSLDSQNILGHYKRILKCEHVFHKKCIDTWIQENETCPICRLPI